MVSIIMLTYNHEKYIRQALTSVLSQNTSFSYEVLIGNDSSTDRTAQIIEEFMYPRDKRIRVYTHECNMGGSANLAVLLKQARGKYIASCEGDDYWTDPRKLQKQVNFLECHAEYIGCTHKVTLVDKDGTPYQKQSLSWVKNTRIYTLSDFKGIYLPGHPVSMVYRNIFLNNPSVIELIEKVHRNIADRTIAVLLSSRGTIVRLDDNMACYRQVLEKDSSSLTSIEFAFDSYGKLTDMKIANQLESYLQAGGCCIRFDGFRLRLVVKTFLKAILFRSSDSMDCCKKLLQEWRKFLRNRKNKGDFT